MDNYLLNILEKYFDEILRIEGKLIMSEALLVAKKNEIIKENREYKSIVTAITSYRDLTLIGANENLFTPNYKYSINVDDLENEIIDVISQQSCFAVSQAYEIFETYIIEILTEYLFQNQNSLQTVRFVIEEGVPLRPAIRNMVKNNQKKNNRGLLSMMRKLSPTFKEFEVKNIHEINISNWFDLLSMIRHILVHNRQVVSQRFLKYLQESNASEMFERHFKQKNVGGNICIFLEKNNASDIIDWLSTFAHFIFKSLSIEADLPFRVPQYIPEPWPREFIN